MTYKSLPRISSAGLLLTFSVTAQAAALQGTLHEGFDYTAGTVFGLNGTTNALLNGGIGFNPTGTATANDGFELGGGWGNPGTADGLAVPVGVVSTIPGSPANGGSLVTVNASGLSYTDLDPVASYLGSSGLAMRLNGNASSASIGRNLQQSIDSGTVYFSYLVNKLGGTARSTNVAFFRNNQNTTTGAWSNHELFSFGQNGGSSTNLVINFNSSDGAGGFPGATGATVANGNATAGTTFPSPVDGSTVTVAGTPISWTNNQTYLVVGRIIFNYSGDLDRITIWVDPTDLANYYNNTPYIDTGIRNIGRSMSGTTVLTTTGGITGIRPFAGNNAANELLVDEIRFGPTFTSVLTTTPSSRLTAPVITTQPASTTVDCPNDFAPGSDVVLSVAATGNGLFYQWRKDGVDIVGAIEPTLTFPSYSLTFATSGNYTCRAYNDAGSVVTDAATVIVRAAAGSPDSDGDGLSDSLEQALAPLGFDEARPQGTGASPDLVARFNAIQFGQTIADVRAANPDNAILGKNAGGKFDLEVAIQQTADMLTPFADLTGTTITGGSVAVEGNEVKVTLPAPAGTRQFNRVSATAAP